MPTRSTTTPLPASPPRSFDPKRDLVDPQVERWSLLLSVFAGVLPPTALSTALRQTRTATALLDMDATAIADVAGVPTETALEFVRRSNHDEVRVAAAREAQFLDHNPERLVGRSDPDYPRLLSWSHTAPPALWVRGRYDVADAFAFAAIGASHCDTYGEEQAQNLGAYAAEQGLTVVNGGERGVDAHTLKAVLDHGGRAIVTLGAGLCGHARKLEPLYQRVSENGAVLSTVPLNEPPNPVNQVAGDHLTAALSLAMVIVQSGVGGGALIAARVAEEAGRGVLALPAPIGAPASAGSNRLIQQGRARILLDPDEIVETMTDTADELVHNAARRRLVQGLSGEAPWFGELDRDVRRLMRVLQKPMTEDELAYVSDLPRQTVKHAVIRARVLGMISVRGNLVCTTD